MLAEVKGTGLNSKPQGTPTEDSGKWPPFPVLLGRFDGKGRTIRELLAGRKHSIDYYQREYECQQKQGRGADRRPCREIL